MLPRANTEHHAFRPIRHRLRPLRDPGTHQRHHRRSRALLRGCAPTGSTSHEPYRHSDVSRGATSGELQRQTRNTMRSDPSGTGSGPSETQERTSDTTDGPARSSGAAHRQGAPAMSPIATPTFLVEPPAEAATDQSETPCVPTHLGPAPAPQRPRNAPATPPTVPRAPPGLRTDREHQPRALSTLPRFSWCREPSRPPPNAEHRAFRPIRGRPQTLRHQGTHQRQHRRPRTLLRGCAPTESTSHEPYLDSNVSRGANNREPWRQSGHTM